MATVRAFGVRLLAGIEIFVGGTRAHTPSYSLGASDSARFSDLSMKLAILFHSRSGHTIVKPRLLSNTDSGCAAVRIRFLYSRCPGWVTVRRFPFLNFPGKWRLCAYLEAKATWEFRLGCMYLMRHKCIQDFNGRSWCRRRALKTMA